MTYYTARLTKAGQTEAIRQTIELSGEWIDYSSIFQGLETSMEELLSAQEPMPLARHEIGQFQTISKRPEFVSLGVSAFDIASETEED